MAKDVHVFLTAIYRRGGVGKHTKKRSKVRVCIVSACRGFARACTPSKIHAVPSARRPRQENMLVEEKKDKTNITKLRIVQEGTQRIGGGLVKSTFKHVSSFFGK